MTANALDIVTFGSGMETGEYRAPDVYEAREDRVDLVAFFYRLDNYPDKKRSNRVALIAELLSELGQRAAPETRNTLCRLGKALSKYQWSIQVVPTVQGFRELLRVPAGLSAGDRWEHNSVRTLLDLLQKGMLKIRRCVDPVCEQWFYLDGRLDQKYHHPNCKQRHYDEKKRAYMREYTAEEKKRAANPRNGVGLKPVKRKLAAARKP